MKKLNVSMIVLIVLISIPILLFWMYPLNLQAIDFQVGNRISPMHLIGFLGSLALFYLGFRYWKKDDATQGAFIIEVAIIIIAVILKTLLNI